MNCILDILDTFLPGASEGGQWELLGFSLTESGPYGSGGNWPWSTNPNDHVMVNFNDIIQGYYKLNYFATGDCGGLQEVIIPVVGGGDAGTTKNITICTSSNSINIANELLAVYDTGVLQADFQFTGNGVGSSAYIPGDANTPLDDEFDPALVGPGSYQITLSITPQIQSPYTLSTCDSCLPTTATLFITVEESDISISISNCHIVLDSQLSCDNATFELHKDTGSGFVPTGITTLPYQVTEDADWKLVGTGCDCGIVESNIIDSTGCCSNGNLQIIFDSDFCGMFLIGTFGCSPGTFKWYRSCNNGNTWEYFPQFDNDTFIFVNDDCCWQLVRECPDGCIWTSNIACASGCAGGCNGALAASYGTCTYTVAGGPICPTTGTLTLQKLVGGTWITDQSVAFTTYPHTFTITSDGTFRAVLNCDNDNCPEYVGPQQTFTGCGPSCVSNLSTTVNGCTITAIVTNCPSPTYTFLDSSNNVLYTGPNNSFTVSGTGTYTVQVAGCPNCPTLSANAVVTNCNNSCNSILSLSANGCTVTASVTNCPNPTYTFKLGATTLQSGPSNIYTHPNGGTFTIDVEVTGCPNCTILTDSIQITCTTGCNCSTNITEIGCQLFASDSNCSGYTAIWRWFDSTNGIWVTKGTGSSIVPDENGLWERRLTKAGCPPVIDQINVTCVGPGCTLSLDTYEIDSNDCTRVNFSYSGALSSNVNIQFTYPQANPTDCNTAGGWTVFNPTGSWGSNTGGTGGGYFNVPSQHFNKCLRIIISDNDNPSCPPVVGYLFVPICCQDNPTIQVTGCAPYTLQVINAPGAAFLWSTGDTTSSIEVYDGTFSVVVTIGDCDYTLSETVTCCSDPCLTDFEHCIHYYWFAALSSQTAGVSSVDSFIVDGVQQISSPQTIQFSPSIFVPGSQAAGQPIIMNPSVINTLNNIAPSNVAFDLPHYDDYIDCFNNIAVNPNNNIGFLGLMKIITSVCVSTYDIEINLFNTNNNFGKYKFTQDGLFIWADLNGNGTYAWEDATTLLGTNYMIDNGPCNCEIITLC